MNEDQTYRMQRAQLLFQTLRWVQEKQLWGLSLNDLAEHMNLGEWEVQHLFQEYLHKDPLLLINQFFDPSLIKATTAPQISLFDQAFALPEKKRKVGQFSWNIIQETPEEIAYTTYEHFLGTLFIATCNEGVVQVTFEDAEDGLQRLQKAFPKSNLIPGSSAMADLVEQQMISFFDPESTIKIISLAVKGSPFQVSVWKKLTEIPMGSWRTYGDLALELGDPNASRAVGTAVGANPLALLIPCHRVLHQTGKIGHFRWHSWRKQLLLAIEK